MSDICRICPRECGIDRHRHIGFCGADSKIKIARAALHRWEEPCISGTCGSGAVFFCGCNLRCVFCQNHEISQGDKGMVITAERLSEIFLELQSECAHNINLVTPTHYSAQIKEALDMAKPELKIPVIYNCGGYESAAGLSILKDHTDIYLTDIKYFDNSLALRYSQCKDYFETAVSALRTMLDDVGTPVYDSDGIMRRGVIVRHLVLPSQRHDSIRLLKFLKSEFGTDKFRLSLMSQYTPNGRLEKFPEINRRITAFEYNSAVSAALDLGFTDAYVQERSSAEAEYIPPFDLTGVGKRNEEC